VRRKLTICALFRPELLDLVREKGMFCVSVAHAKKEFDSNDCLLPNRKSKSGGGANQTGAGAAGFLTFYTDDVSADATLKLYDCPRILHLPASNIFLPS